MIGARSGLFRFNIQEYHQTVFQATSPHSSVVINAEHHSATVQNVFLQKIFKRTVPWPTFQVESKISSPYQSLRTAILSNQLNTAPMLRTRSLPYFQQKPFHRVYVVNISSARCQHPHAVFPQRDRLKRIVSTRSKNSPMDQWITNQNKEPENRCRIHLNAISFFENQ